MISETSNILSTYGPVDLPTITNMLQQIQEKLWNHPGNVLFMSIWGSTDSGNLREMYVLCTIFLNLLSMRIRFFRETLNTY